MHGDQFVHQLHAFLEVSLLPLALAPFLLGLFLLVERFAVGLGVLVPKGRVIWNAAFDEAIVPRLFFYLFSHVLLCHAGKHDIKII